VEDTKTLVAGAASNQEQLANAAGSAVMTITELADCVKHGAASLGSEQPDAQVCSTRLGFMVSLMLSFSRRCIHFKSGTGLHFYTAISDCCNCVCTALACL